MKRVAVLLSGSGTNLASLIQAVDAEDFPAKIALVISNRPKAYGLERASIAGIPTAVLRHRNYPDRESYDQALVDVLHEHRIEWVCLAGFMRIVTPVFLGAFPSRVLNVHPALLPAFPGLHGQEQTLNYGVRIAGATVHFVDEGCDTGAIILQGAVPVLPDDDIDGLKARILEIEHKIYPIALRWAVEERLVVDGRKVRVDLRPGESTLIFQPATR